MVHGKPSSGLICALGAVLTLCVAIDILSSVAPLARFADQHVSGPYARLRTNFAQLPLTFEPNQGQTDRDVKFLSRGRGYTLFLTGEEAVLAVPGSVLRMRLLGSNPAPQMAAVDKLPGESNYFLGRDPTKWHRDIPHYARVLYRNVFPDVDLVFYGNQRQLEFDLVVGPGGDPARIRLGFSGGRTLEIGAEGDLLSRVGDAEVRFHKPLVYQRMAANEAGRQFLDGRYVLRGEGEIGFQVADYDRSKTLVIDPVLSYSTFLGGSGFDAGAGIAVDRAGSAYVTGETASIDFPTAGAYQGSNQGTSDVFVTKLDPSGTSLVYSTYLGGALAERGTSIAVDSAGNACVTGRTNSEDFPLSNAWQSQLFGDFDAFVSELNAQGNALRFSTYLGGSGNDEASGVAVDSTGNIYVTGGAGVLSRDDFPTTQGAFQRLYGGGMVDAFVTKFDPAQTGSATLVYSTFLGGGAQERGNSIAVDSAGNAYITGRTSSSADFPIRNPLQPGYGGGTYDAFVTELNAAGTDLVYSTYLGSTGSDQGHGIAVDSAGNAYVTGETDSSGFPTMSAFQTASGGGKDAFVSKISSTGSSLLYSTYLGGSGSDLASGIAVDTAGIVYLTGRTSTSAGFPTTPDAIQPTFGGGPNDAFIAKIDPSQSGLASLIHASYLGGSGNEDMPSGGPAGNPTGAIAVDASGNAYITGNTSSTDFPGINGYQMTYGGGTADGFAVRVSFGSGGPDYSVSAAPASVTTAPGGTATYTVTVSPTGGFTGNVDLTVDGVPTDASGVFAPATIVITDATAQTSILSVNTSSSTPLGTFPLSITATAGTLQHSVPVTLVMSNDISADLSITKNASSNPVEVQTNLSYSIRAINQGPAVATGVQVTDTLPSSVVWVSTASTQGTCTGDSTITCSIGTLDVGSIATVTIVVQPQAIGSISNTAAITGDQPDPNPDNNTATIATTVEAACPGPGPCMLDPNLSVNTVVSGLTEPTGIAFLGADDFLVLEKSTGQVKRVVNGVVQGVVLDLAVNAASERGLLGIALHPDFASNGFVYLYWTCRGQPAADDCDALLGDDTTDLAQVPLRGNRVDRFIWDGSALTLDLNLIRLRAYQADADANGNFNQPLRGNHDGGKIVFGPDRNLYILIGDNGRRGNLQNISDGVLPNGQDDQFGGPQPDDNHFTGVIIRLNDDGTTPADNPFFAYGGQVGGEAGANIQRIFAYGVRNSFGMAFDPLTGKLWNEENGDDSFDEINVIAPGANNGWVQAMGPVQRISDFKAIETSPQYFGLQQVRWPPTLIADTPDEALGRLQTTMLPGGFYNDPLFSWKYAVAPSPIGFVNGTALGSQYQGDLIVGAARTFLAGGYLFDFKLTADRSDLDLSADPRLADRVADNGDKFDVTESESLLIGRDFGITTDIQTSPAGTLYVVSLSNGAVYEILAAWPSRP
jgi:uncharacterized repeat protein (TIGR01451 family)